MIRETSVWPGILVLRPLRTEDDLSKLEQTTCMKQAVLENEALWERAVEQESYCTALRGDGN